MIFVFISHKNINHILGNLEVYYLLWSFLFFPYWVSAVYYQAKKKKKKKTQPNEQKKKKKLIKIKDLCLSIIGAVE